MSWEWWYVQQRLQIRYYSQARTTFDHAACVCIKFVDKYIYKAGAIAALQLYPVSSIFFNLLSTTNWYHINIYFSFRKFSTKKHIWKYQLFFIVAAEIEYIFNCQCQFRMNLPRLRSPSGVSWVKDSLNPFKIHVAELLWEKIQFSQTTVKHLI